MEKLKLYLEKTGKSLNVSLKKFKKINTKKKLGILAIVVVGIIQFTVIYSFIKHSFISDSVTIKYSEKELINLDIETVTEKLKDNGFTHIQYKERLVKSSEYKDKVTDIRINDKHSFSKEEEFKENDLVLITYNNVITKDFGFSESNCDLLNYNDASEMLKLIGFYNVEVTPVNSLKDASEIEQANTIHKIEINNSSDRNFYDVPIDAKINIYYDDFKSSTLPINSSDLDLTKNYEEYVKIFNDNGFNNIKLIPNKNITDAHLPNKKISSISINDKKEFSTKDNISLSTEIVIEYNDYIDVKIPVSSNAINYTLLHTKYVKDFEDAGFINIKINKLENLTWKDRWKKNRISTIQVNGQDTFNQDDLVSLNSEIVINYLALKQGETAPTPTPEPTTGSISWFENELSWWDGAHSTVNKLIKNNLLSSSSFDHKETKYIGITNLKSKKDVADIISPFNETVELSDVVVIVDFSASNAFGVEIDQQAYVLGKHKNKTFKLLAIR